MRMVAFYRQEKVTEHIQAIRSLTGEILYLIEGENKAILIDTCLGVGHLREFVESLTDKPVTVLLSHGHIDHAMGAPEFENVYMNHADTDVYNSMTGIEDRKGYIAAGLGEAMPDFTEEDFVPPSPMTFRNLQEGDCFDAGGIHVDVYALPGHTKGSMIFLVREERILILGDACNKSTFLFDENALPVETYRENLIRIRERLLGRYDRVFISHHDLEMSVDTLGNVIRVCDDILGGRTDDVPFVFMGQTNYIAKAVGEQMNRLDGIDGNIIYNKDKVRK